MALAKIIEVLRRESIPFSRILITGASGWIGRETVALLHGVLGEEFSHRVTLAGSRDSKIVVDGITHHVRKLFDINPDEKFDAVIHLAFLTQEKADIVGVEDFMRINREISEFVYTLCQHAHTGHVIMASSGAADPVVLKAFKNPAKRVYGESKRESEEIFAQLRNHGDAKVEICRIWSISGRHFLTPTKYALGNFIEQAKSTGNIHVANAATVERAYIDAGEMMGVLLLGILGGEGELINSGGFETSLQELAQLVLDEFNPGGKVIVSARTSGHEDDIYAPDVTPFNSLATRLGVQLSDLKDQIRTTAASEVFHSQLNEN